MRQQLITGRGGVLYFELPDAPDADSLTITIQTQEGEDLPEPVDAVPLANPFSFDGAMAAVAESDEITYTLPDGAAVPSRGAVFTLTNELGQVQECQARDVLLDDDEVTLRLRSMLDFTVTEGTLVGHRVQYLVSAENAAENDSNFRAVVRYTVDGDYREFEETYDTGLSQAYNPASYADLLRKWPAAEVETIRSWLGTALDSPLLAGYDSVERILAANDRNINRVRNRKALTPLILNRAMRSMAEQGHVPSAWATDIPGYIDLLDQDFDKQFGLIIGTLQWYDDDDDGAASEEEMLLNNKVGNIQLVK